MRRKSFCDDACTVARSLDVIGDWWSLLIMRDVLSGKTRFGELQRSLGVAKNILSRRLRELVAHHLLDSRPAADGGPHREYFPTDRGKALLPVIVAIGQWGAGRLFDPSEERYVALDARDGRPLRSLELVAADGRRLAPEEVVLGLAPADS